MRDNEIPFDNEEYKTDLTLQEAIDLLNECGTNINSQQEPKVLELINNALNKLEIVEKILRRAFREPSQEDLNNLKTILNKNVRRGEYTDD